jgi:hypothetical protein
MDGWIKLHRKIIEHWIWKDPEKLKWWLDMLLSVNHAPTKVNVGMQLFDCDRGQSIMSLSNWAERWKVSRDTVRNFFTLLKNDGMIHTENLTKSTRITIYNYDSYQEDLHDGQTLTERKANASQTQSDTNKNEKNDKNINNNIIGEKSKRFIPPTLEEIKSFILEKKYAVNAEKFFNYYASNGWKVGKNKMKDWKAAVRTWQQNEYERNAKPIETGIVLTDNSPEKYNDKLW